MKFRFRNKMTRIAVRLLLFRGEVNQSWDNDGIVNTTSMFWPRGETLLVVADHLDIVGHYRFRGDLLVQVGLPLPPT
jgi:hypothetical protein